MKKKPKTDVVGPGLPDAHLPWNNPEPELGTEAATQPTWPPAPSWASGPAPQMDAPPGSDLPEESVIELEDLGAITRLEIPAVPGRLTILRGPNGAGKSTAINAIESLCGRKQVSLSSRDGTTGGYVSGFGAKMTVARNGANRRSGKLLAVTLEDGIGLNELVDPHVQDPVAADLRRIKILARLFEVEVDEERIGTLLGMTTAQVQEMVAADSLVVDDPVEKIERVKRDFHAAARRAEDLEQRIRGEIQSLQGSVGNAPPLPEGMTIEKAKEELGTAAAALQDLKSRKEVAAQNEVAWKAAEKLLEQVPEPLSDEKLQGDLTQAESEWEEAHAELQRIQRELNHAEQVVGERQAEVRRIRGEIEGARIRRESRAAAEKALASRSAPPTDEQIDVAEGLVEAKTEQLQAAGKSGEIAKTRAQIAEKEKEATLWQNRAGVIRKGADDLVSLLVDPLNKVLGTRDLRISGPMRLVRKNHKRGEVFFAELSDGEKWRDAIPLAVSRFEETGGLGILCIPQEAWEGLDTMGRRMILERIRDTDLVVFTAEASNDTTDEPEALTARLA